MVNKWSLPTRFWDPFWRVWVFGHALPWNSAIWLLGPNIGNSPQTLGDVYHWELIDDLSPCLGFTYSDEDGRRGYRNLRPSFGPLPTLRSRRPMDEFKIDLLPRHRDSGREWRVLGMLYSWSELLIFIQEGLVITDTRMADGTPWGGAATPLKIFRSCDSLAYTSLSEPTKAVALQYLYEGLPLATVRTVPSA